jgi:ABC-type multidrug transport system fused ATPase/permease subunit
VIAHRLSTIKKANVIAVISQGKIVEMGSHDQLKKAGGVYSFLIKHQEF